MSHSGATSGPSSVLTSVQLPSGEARLASDAVTNKLHGLRQFEKAKKTSDSATRHSLAADRQRRHQR